MLKEFDAKERKMNAARMKIERSKNEKRTQQERQLNAARTKNETALCELRSRESDGTRALVITQRSRESFFIPTRAADWKGRSVSSTTSALGRSLAISTLTRRESPSPQKIINLRCDQPLLMSTLHMHGIRIYLLPHIILTTATV